MSDKFFSSRYPILAALMVGVSDLNFAIACQQSGIFPSLIVTEDSNAYPDKLNQALKDFYQATGTRNINVGSHFDFLYDPKLVSVLKSNQVSHIEFYAPHPITFGDIGERKKRIGEEKYTELCRKSFIDLQNNNVKIMRRRITTIADKLPYDAYCLKGSDGAGYSGKLTTMEFFKQQHISTPNKILIPASGIGTAKQVREYIDLGASAVAIGSRLAASIESNLSIETKKKMIKATSKDIVTMPDTGQQALVFGNVDEIIASKERNRQSSLMSGINGTGGHIYAGPSLEYITEILTLKEIVLDLVSDL